jgi:hypothetical protein
MYEVYLPLCFIKLSIIFAMTIILSFSDTTLLDSVIVYCPTVATFIVSIFDELVSYTEIRDLWVSFCG